MFDRNLVALVPLVIRRWVVDYDAFVRWNCEPDVNLKAGAVAMLRTWSNHSDAATGNAPIVRFEPLYFS